jgi:hypothetical protein
MRKKLLQNTLFAALSALVLYMAQTQMDGPDQLATVVAAANMVQR